MHRSFLPVRLNQRPKKACPPAFEGPPQANLELSLSQASFATIQTAFLVISGIGYREDHVISRLLAGAFAVRSRSLAYNFERIVQ